MSHSKEDLKKYKAMSKEKLIEQIEYWITEYYKENGTRASLCMSVRKNYNLANNFSTEYEQLVTTLIEQNVSLPIRVAMRISDTLKEIEVFREGSPGKI